MNGFTETWRKRLACERCRHLKVRCEYSSPTNDTCIRCEKSKTPCIIATPKRKNNGGNGGSAAELSSQKSSKCDSNGSMVRPHDGDSKMSDFNPITRAKLEINGQSSEVPIMRGKAEHAAYLQRILCEAKEKLIEINISPLSQALSSGLYTLEEVQRYYDHFLANPCLFPLIYILKLPAKICELDVEWPWLTIAIVSSRAINCAQKSKNSSNIFLDGLFSSPIDGYNQELTLDRLAGQALICQYALSSHVDRALATLFHMHSTVIACVRKFHTEHKSKEEQIALHLGAVTILPYIMIKNFNPLNSVLNYYMTVINNGEEINDGSFLPLDSQSECVMDQHLPAAQGTEDARIFTSCLLVEMLRGSTRALNTISTACDISEIRGVVECYLQCNALLENQAASVQINFLRSLGKSTENPGIPAPEDINLFPLRSCYIAVRLKVLKMATVRMLALSSAESPNNSELVTACFKYVISEGANFGSKLFRIFAYTDASSPLIPTYVLHGIPEALISVQCMRFAAFANSVDIDVRSDCLTELVVMKWEEMVKSSIMARQYFLLLFPALDTSSVKIGEVNPEHVVIGSGLMREFSVILCDGSIKNIREQYRISRESFQEVIQAVFRNRELYQEKSILSNANVLSLPVVLNLLLFRL